MPLAFKQVLGEIMDEKDPGPSTTFSIFHVLHAIELIAEKAVGRSRLAEELGAGEGAERTIISRLKGAQLIITLRTGCALTNKGRQIWNEYKKVFRSKVEIEANELTLTDYNFAILLKNCGYKVRSGMEQRDVAIIAGVKGARASQAKPEYSTLAAAWTLVNNCG